MAASFSSHRDAGGTLHLPSPSASIHHVHSASAINQLRRSLSKSPSKSSDFRFFSAANSSSGHLNAHVAANGTSDRPAAACASPSKQPHPHSLQSLPPSHHHHHHHHRAPSFHHTLSHSQDDDNDNANANDNNNNNNSVTSSTTTSNPFVPVPVPRPVSSSLSPSRRARAQPQGKLFLVQSARIPAASTSSPLSASRSSSAKQPRYPHPYSTSAAGAGASHSPVAKNTTATTTRTTTVAAPAVASAINPSSSSIITPATSTRFTHPNPRHALRRTASLQLCRVRNALNTTARGSTSPSRRPRQQQLHQHQLRPVLNESKNQGNALPRPATDKTDSFCATKNMTPLFRARTLNTNTPSVGKIDAPPPPLFSSSSSAAVPSPSPLPPKHPQSLHIDKRRRDPLAPASRSASNPFAITSSPLKRSDEAMNLDEDNVADSPSPKRRSVEGPVSSQSSFTSSKNNLDFTVFNTENRNPDLETTASADLLSTSAPTSRPAFGDIEPPLIFAVPQSPASSSIPKRSSSLRKSTLQQRQSERPFSLFSPQLDTSAEDVDGDDSGVRTLHTRARSRTCSDAPADNDFSPSSPFFNANSTASPATLNPQHQRLQQLQAQQNTSSHPLSRTLTQSSSEESLLDDSPSHEPVRNSLEKARPILHFSKSLPAGSTRPNYDSLELQTHDTAAGAVAAGDASFATPINYRLVKPLPAAFMSTGLISKKNKNAEDVALAGTKNMPDTPCKRSIFPLLGASTSAAGPTSGSMIVAGSGNSANNAGNGSSIPRSATVTGGKHKTMNRSALGTSVLCASQSGTSESAGGHDIDNDEMNKTTTTTTTMTDSLEEMNDRSNNINHSNDGNFTANISTTAGTTFKTTPHPGPFSKGLGIFGSSFVKSRMMRRSSSSGSIDGDPSQASPSAKYGFNHGKNTSLDAEFPPTPTKAFTPANGNQSATGTIGGGSSIFQTAHTSRFAKPSSSRRLLLQDGLAQSPQGRGSPFSTADGGGVTTPSGLTCKFSSCSSPSSPTSGETVSDSEYESDDDMILDLGLDDGDEDGDTAMDGSPSLLGVHHRRLHHHGRSASQSHGLPFSFASSKRVSRPRFLHESTRSPSPKEKNFATQSHKPLPSSSPPQQSSLFHMIAVEQPAKHALHPTASPLYGRTSLFKQPASADQTAAQKEQPDFGSQSSTPHTPLDTNFPQESLRLSIFGQNGISATPVANAATATPAANGNSIFGNGFGGNVSSAGSTKSYFGDNFTTHTAAGFPATPTGPRESFVGSLGNGGAPGTVDINALKKASLRGNSHEKVDIDVCLTNRFQRVEIIGIGEFSQVFMVADEIDGDENDETLSSAMNGVTTTPDANAMTPFHSPSLPVTRNMLSTVGNNEKVWAVKKSKQPSSGARDRERRAKEVEALKVLKGSAHVISYEDSWEDNGYLYIQTEFCEEGSLKDFLDVTGWKGRADDFRIWKILMELAEGLKHIHDSGYIHLDIKPANVLIAADGTLKIADFGLATPWPAEHGIDGEGDREYIGPEILMGRYDKPADIFALGLIIFEAASNVELPDNGLAWQKLRNGDMSDVPTLSWRDDADCPTVRDTRGMPVAEAFSFSPGAAMSVRPGELAQPPEFMVNPAHESSLDSVVRWMISPDPADRPTARQILNTSGARWVAQRRRAGATIYEGNWGPADVVDDEQQEQSGEDEEMIDV